jgi:hypothetical protein
MLVLVFKNDVEVVVLLIMKTSQYGTMFTSSTTSTPLNKLKKEIAKKREKEKIKSQNVQHDQ